MVIQWQDVGLQGLSPNFAKPQPVQYTQVIPMSDKTTIETTQNPWLNSSSFQPNTTQMSNTSFGQPIKQNININNRVSQFLTNARNNAIGAQYSQSLRNKQGYYDCSSYITRNLNQFGIKVNPNMTTASMPTDMKKAGFSMIPFNPNDLREGDILWKNGHTEIYSGNGNTIGAHSTKSGVGERNLFASNGKMIVPYTHVFRRDWS